jgi:hypothetical protein
VRTAKKKADGAINYKATADTFNIDTWSDGRRLHASIPQPERLTFSGNSNLVQAFTAGAKETYLFIIKTMQLLSHYCTSPHPFRPILPDG